MFKGYGSLKSFVLQILQFLHSDVTEIISVFQMWIIMNYQYSKCPNLDAYFKT